MKMSPEIGELAKALSAAQAAMEGAEKDRANPFFKSSYATFASVVGALREPFAKNQLAFSQPTRVEADGGVTVETIIMHSSGQWISGDVTAKPVKNDPQGVGSLMSYLKRYGLQAITGIASRDDDDDGNAASGKGATPMGKPQGGAKSPPPSEITRESYDQSRKQLAATIALENAHAAVKQEETFEIPFGEHGNTAIYTGTNAQKTLLKKDAAKFAGITDVKVLQAMSAKAIELGVDVEELEKFVKDWVTENGK